MKKLLPLFAFCILLKSLSAQGPFWVNGEHSWDTIDFETAYPFFELDSSSQNIWQIASPHKQFFNSAYSHKYSIVTDSINFYPSNNNSFFEIKIGRFNYEYYYDERNILIEFRHKFDTDRLKDGGFMTLSYDNGVTWLNVIDYSLENILQSSRGWLDQNMYTDFDTLFNGEKGFSGHSSNWVQTNFGWVVPGVKKSNTLEISDTLILRFNFISDDINTNKEGWLIDDIRLYSVFTSVIPDFNPEQSIRIFPNPSSSELTIDLIKNYKNIAVKLLDFSGKVLYSFQYHNKQIIFIQSGSLIPGIYLIKLSLDNTTKITRKVKIE